MLGLWQSESNCVTCDFIGLGLVALSFDQCVTSRDESNGYVLEDQAEVVWARVNHGDYDLGIGG